MQVLLLVASVVMAMTMTESVHFDHEFVYKNCDDLHCVDPVYNVKGPCSIICPQGQTCRHPITAEVLKADRIYDINGQKCQCKDQRFPDWDIAFCSE